MPKDFFCSEISANAGESMVGTASMFDQMLLVEYPKPWSSKPLVNNDMSDAVKGKIMALQAVLPNTRVVLIKKTETDENDADGISVFGVNNRENHPTINVARFQNLEEIIEFDLTGLFSDDYPVKQDTPLYLVCTNGKKDKCCSKWGLPLYKLLKSRLDGVWQCTHVGGDRFAPNLLYLPHGIYYGRISADEIDSLIDSHSNGEIYLDKFRGRSCYFSVEQAAEYFLRKETGILSMGDFLLSGSERQENGTWTVIFRDVAGELIHHLKILKKESEEPDFLSCDSIEKKTRKEFELVEFKTDKIP